MKRLFRIFVFIILFFLALGVTLHFLLASPRFQQKALLWITQRISNQYNANIVIDSVAFQPYGKLELYGINIPTTDHRPIVTIDQLAFSILSFNIFKKTVTPKNLYLEGIVLHLQREANSSTWNYDFLIAPSQNHAINKNNWNWSFEKGHIHLQNFQLYYIDQLNGTDVKIDIPQMTFNTHSFNQPNKELKLKSINISKPNVYVGIYSESEWSKTRKKLTPTPDLKFLIHNFQHQAFNEHHWQLSLDQLILKEGYFQLRYEELPYYDHLFDYRNIEITEIELAMNDWKVKGDTLTTHIQQLSAQERSGLTIQQLNSQLTLSPHSAHFDELTLYTPLSEFKGRFQMDYNNFYAFLDYNNYVNMYGDFHQGSKVAWKDLSYFATTLIPMQHNVTSIEGTMSGPVAHLIGNHIYLSDGLSKVVTDIEIKGLPETATTTYNFSEFKAQTNGMGIAYYAPHLMPPSAVTSLTDLTLSGQLSFSEEVFNFAGLAKSNLGNLDIETQLSQPFSTSNRVLESALLETHQLDIGTLINSPQTLKLTGWTHIQSHLKQPYQLNANFSDFIWNHVHIPDVHLSGKGTINDWVGKISFNNHLGNVKTLINYSQPESDHFQLTIQQELNDLSIHKLFPNLPLSELTLEGQWQSKINQFQDILKINFETIYLKNKNNSLPYHQLYLELEDSELSTHLSLESADIDLQVNGQWNWDSFKKFFDILQSRQWEKYNTEQPTINLWAKIKYENTDHLLTDLFSSLYTEGVQELMINMNSDQEQLSWEGKSPFFRYSGISLKELNTQGKVVSQQLLSKTASKEVGFYDIEWMKDWKMEAETQGEQMIISLKSEGSEQIKDLNAQFVIQRQDHHYFIKFLPSSFKVASETWRFPIINTDYHIRLTNKEVSFNPILLESEQQRIRIASNQGLLETIHRVDFNRVNLNFLNAFIPNQYQINGSVTGQAFYKVTKNQSSVLNYELKSEDIYVQNHNLGQLIGAGQINFEEQKISFNPHQLLGKEHYITWQGDFFWNDTHPLKLNINFESIPLEWSSLFLNSIFKDFKGGFKGHLALNGLFHQPNWNGVIQADQLSFTPRVTGVQYSIPAASVQILNNQWTFNDLQIFDKNKNSGSGNGFIKSHNWKDWEIGLEAHSNKIQLIDLGIKEQEYYYGDINGKAFLNIDGFLDHLTISVNAAPLKNSKLFIPIQDDTEMQQFSYIQFIEQHASKHKIDNNDKIDFYLQSTIDDQLEVTLILDESLRDQITARGKGHIQLSSDGKNPFKMNGTYTIDHGTYDFVFRQLEVIHFRRKFLIQSNSIIKWDGDPWNALLDVKGYTLVKARLYDLISSEADRMNLSQQELRDAQTPQSILVNLELKGLLNNPIFNFNLDLEEGRSLGTLAHQKLQRINQNTRILINQVGALLLLEQFVPNEGLTNADLASGSINNMSEIVSSAASSQITNFANKVLGMEDLVIGLKYKNYNFTHPQEYQGIEHWNRNEAGIQVRKNFLSNRLMVEVGGSYDWGKTQSEGSSNDFMGDFRIQYYITEDGKVRLNAFRNSQYDVLYGKTVARQGVGIGYKKSFNHINIFKRAPESKDSLDRYSEEIN